ncbi:MAG TPA: DNA polymerase I [Candidatus Acidoferrum sp.]|nr:DNA polymerase I [Candidatus Acidoferrum sp.]
MPAATGYTSPMAAPKPLKKLFLIDAMGFIFRAFFAPMERLRSPSGMPTKVPYLFTQMVRRLVRDYQPDYMGVAFDLAGPTFRDKLFAEYKAQRPPMPEELAQQLPYVRKLCEALRLPILAEQGYEADDIIGTLAAQAAKRKLDILVITSDKDMLQLVGGPVRVLIPTKQDLMVDAAKVEELLGVPPNKVVDVMALMGDSIDNIPGAKGIGEKGARELIQRFGSVEKALDNADKVEGKRYREALQTQREQVMMSKQLAKIATDAPIKLDLDLLTFRVPNAEALRALYSELGFTSLLKELGPSAAASAEAASGDRDYGELKSADEIQAFLKKAPREQEIAVFLTVAPDEQHEDAGFGSRVASIELSPRAGVARGFILNEKETLLEKGSEDAKLIGALQSWLGDAKRPKIVHDPKLVPLLLGDTAGIRHATILYSYLLRPTTAKHDFADAVLRYLNINLGNQPGERADALQQLGLELRRQVDEQGLTKVYEMIDLPLAPVLAEMERTGVRVDPTALAVMSAALQMEIRVLESRIWGVAGTEFNINSPKQLGEILFDKLNLQPPPRMGKARSTAAEVLEALAPMHELPRKVLEYREVTKLKSTYVDALPRLINTETGRLHTRFSQTGTATGRLSSSEPNLQNIPVRTEAGRRIRAAFAAENGMTLLSADYSQIELRILAHLSEDPVLVEAFRKSEDIHSRTAQEVFGVGPMGQTAEHRRAAKVINFGIIYGLSAFGLAQQLGIDTKEASQFISAYFARYSGVKAFLDGILEEVRKSGFTRTMFGRVRPIPEINSTMVGLRNFAERTAMNTPLQGAAADLIKLAMIEISRRLKVEGFRGRMILQVHDELLFEAPKEELARLSVLVRECMEQAHELKVPLKVDLKAGPNWRDMDPVEG